MGYLVLDKKEEFSFYRGKRQNSSCPICLSRDSIVTGSESVFAGRRGKANVECIEGAPPASLLWEDSNSAEALRAVGESMAVRQGWLDPQVQTN